MASQVAHVSETTQVCQLIQKYIRNNTIQMNDVVGDLNYISEEKNTLIKSMNEMAEIAIQITAATQSINSSVISQTSNIGEVSTLGMELMKIAQTLRSISEEFKI